MRMVFGLLSLVFVLAVVGWLARSQLRAVSTTGTAPGMPAAAGAAPQGPAAQSQQLQRKVQDDIAQALQQGANRAASAAP